MQKPQPPLPTQILEMPGNPAANLYQAARLLEQAGDFTDRQWTQGVKARDAQGQPTSLIGDMPLPYYKKSNPAASYCAAGHIERVCAAQPETAQFQPALLTLLTVEINLPLPTWNDKPERTPGEVRKLFCQAAARMYKEAINAAIKIAADPPTDPGPEPAATPKAAAAELVPTL